MSAALRNDFHGRSVVVRDVDRAMRVLGSYPGELTPAERALARRIRDRLCGAQDCTCGIVRGPQGGQS